MNSKNNNGPSTVPCGTPERIWAWSEVLLSIITACVWSFRNAPIHWATGTLSNALAKSRTPTSTWDLAGSFRVNKSCMVIISWVSQEWCFLKPWFRGLSAPCTVYPKKYAHGYCFAVLCCGYTLTDFPYPSGLLHWHCGNLTIVPVPAKQPWWIWINTSCEFIMNDCVTTT